MLKASELILNDDGSIYHLHLRPEHLCKHIILVGDPDRVPLVSQYFDTITHRMSKREFVTHCGTFGKQSMMVISTGIGTDNIDIVLNELDALANIDLENRVVKPELTTLSFYRIGTSGALQPWLEVGSYLASTYAVDMTRLSEYYLPHTIENEELSVHLCQHIFQHGIDAPRFRTPSANMELVDKMTRLMTDVQHGITLTCSGFYGPQGRQLRLAANYPKLLDIMSLFKSEQHYITNLEMETAGIYALAGRLGHAAISLNLILANRVNGTFHSNSSQAMESFILKTLRAIEML